MREFSTESLNFTLVVLVQTTLLFPDYLTMKTDTLTSCKKSQSKLKVSPRTPESSGARLDNESIYESYGDSVDVPRRLRRHCFQKQDTRF